VRLMVLGGGSSTRGKLGWAAVSEWERKEAAKEEKGRGYRGGGKKKERNGQHSLQRSMKSQWVKITDLNSWKPPEGGGEWFKKKTGTSRSRR